MAKQPDPPPATTARPPRRRQEDRTQETRRKAIDAAIALIATRGYAATTTSDVSEAAGISRGGMLHHYPTKIDLMDAVVRDVETRLRNRRRDAISTIGDPVERFVGLTDATWETFQGDEIIALTEIVLAMRGDPALQDRLGSVVEEMDRWNLVGSMSVARRAGIDDVRLVQAMHHLHYAAMRGLAIEATILKDRSKLDDALGLLRWYKSVFTAAALAGGGDEPGFPSLAYAMSHGHPTELDPE